MTPGARASYVSTVALKIRVTCSHGRPGLGPVPRLIYKAEAYEEGDEFRETLWACNHNHESVEDALNCGLDWLEQGTQLESA
jgi:hypothetical protein